MFTPTRPAPGVVDVGGTMAGTSPYAAGGDGTRFLTGAIEVHMFISACSWYTFIG